MMDSLIGAPPPIEGPAPDETIHKLASGKEFLYPQAGPESVLDGLPVDRNVKADAWDAYHASPTPEDFKRQFDALHALPPIAKAQLFDLKFKGKPIEPAFPPDAQTGLLGAPKPIEPPLPPTGHTGPIGAQHPLVPPHQFEPAFPADAPTGVLGPQPPYQQAPEVAAAQSQIAAHPPGPEYSAFPWIQRRGSPPLPSRSAPELAPELQGKPDPLAAHPVQSGIGAAFNLDPTGILPGTAQAVQGLVKAGAPSSTMRERAGGLHDALSGAMEAGTVLLPEQLVADTARTMKILGAAIVSGSATTAGLKHLGIAPEYADLAGDIVGIVAGYGMHWGTAPAEAKALVEASQSAGPTGDHAIDIDLIDKLTRMASQHTQSPLEAEIARNLLRRKYGINIPDAPVTAEPVPTAEEEAHAGEEPAGPPEPPPPPEPVPGTTLSIENAFKDAAGNDIFHVVENGQIIHTGPEDSVKAFVAESATVPNEQAYTKALTDWTKNSTKAAIEYTMEHPEVPHDQALQVVEGQVGRKPEIEDFQVPAEAEMPKPPKPEKPPKAVKPEKPADPKEVGQTAGIPTEPESPETYAVQLQQLREGTRKVVMFPGGQGMPDLTTLEGFSITHDEVTAPDGSRVNNVYVYRKGVGPGMVEPGEIKSAAKNNTLPELLGHTELGMGAPDKTALKGEPIAVTAHAPDGTEVQSTATDAENLPQTVATTHALTPPGGTVSVGPPAKVLAERQGEQIGAPASLEASSIEEPKGVATAPAQETIGAPASIENSQPFAQPLPLTPIPRNVVVPDDGNYRNYGASGSYEVLMNRIYGAYEKVKAGQPLDEVDSEAIRAFTGAENPTRKDLEDAIAYTIGVTSDAIGPAATSALHALYQGGTTLSGEQMDALESLAGSKLEAKDEQPLPNVHAAPTRTIPEQFADAVDLDGKSNEEIDAIADILGIPKTGQRAEAPTGVVSNGEAGTKGTVRTANNPALAGELPESAPGDGTGRVPGSDSGRGSGESGDSTGTVPGTRDELQPGVRTGAAGVGETPERVTEGETSDERGNTPAESARPPKDRNVVGTNHDRDYRIPDGRIVSGSPEKRAAANIEVLNLISKIIQDDRPATVDEQHILAGYVGWGGAKQLFTEKPEWAAMQAEVRGLMSPEEYADARASTQNAHYTGDEIVDSVWHALRHLGVKPGMSWLEPAVGVGNFFGRQPIDLLEGSRRIGVEKDQITAKIAQLLYPDSGVDNAPFQSADMPRDFFDFVASNVPFGPYPVSDMEFRGKPYLTAAIHNYFFAKALSVVRPGGIVAFITSRYSMDAFGAEGQAFRRWVASKADVIGAIRLPSGAFRTAANTDVITDIVFLRRRIDGEAPAGESWIEAPAKNFRTADGRNYGHPVNEYYIKHPEMVLGEQGLQRGQFSDHDYNVKGTVSTENLQEAMNRLPADQFHDWEGKGKKRDAVAIRELKGVDTTGKVGAFFFDQGGKLFRKTSRGEAIPQEHISPAIKTRIRGQLHLRDIATALNAAERAGAADSAVEPIRKLLNEAYDNFVKKHGYLSSRENIKALLGDPDAPLLPWLERKYDQGNKKEGRPPRADKAPTFRKRLFGKTEEVKPENAKEALSVALNNRGFLDWEHLKDLTGLTDEGLRSELAGIVYQNPETKLMETADEYLSGSVRSKLRAARALAKVDSSYEPNVGALEAAQPEDVPPSRISAILGATWIPLETYGQFIREMLGLRSPPQVAHIGDEWVVVGVEHHPTTKWDTKRVNAGKLITAALNLRRIKVYDPVSGGGSVINRDETMAASQRQKEINDHFKTWLFADPTRGDPLVRIYNDVQNDLRLRVFNGSHLTLPGMSRAGLRTGNLEPYQLAAVWRMISQRFVLLNHAPGAGKTYEMIAAGMELKRLGLIQRPMYVVPNSTLGGWQDQFATLYPDKRVLVFSETDLKKDKRRAAIARMATGDWDAVVVPHSSFQFIPVSDAVFNEHYQKKERELTEQIMDAEGAGLDTRMVTRLENARERLLAGLQTKRDSARRDNVISWEQLGIDQLFVDESHEFKKLGFNTKQVGVAGIDNGSNQKTFDLQMKVNYTRTHGRGVVFASGTPVTNTLGELFSIKKYLIDSELEARGISKFDDWGAEFARTKDSFEAKPEGGGYQNKSRYVKFVNLPRLATLLRTFTDVMTSDMLDIPRPAIAGGERRVVLSTMNPDQEEFQHDLQARAASIRSNPRKAMPDNMLTVFGDGGKMAMDARMVNAYAPDDPNGRLSKAADLIYHFWKQSAPTKGTQLVFSDLGVPAEGKAARRPSASGMPSPGAHTDFSPYDELIKKLIKLGIPREEITHMGKAKNKQQRKQIFQAVDEGRIRVLLGSSQKMGVGVNVQSKGYAIHHIDVPARPDILDQREARFIRQGNEHPEVHIVYYTTKGTLDENKFGTVVRKGKFINSLWKGDFTLEESEDVSDGVPSWEMFQALTSGDPRVLRKLEVDNEVDRLSRLQWSFEDQMYGFRRKLQQAQDEIERLTGRKHYLEQAKATRDAAGRTWVINGESFTGDGLSEAAGTALVAAAIKKNGTLGTAHGLDIIASRREIGKDTFTDVSISSGPIEIARERLYDWAIPQKDLDENIEFNKEHFDKEPEKWRQKPIESAKPASLIQRLENDIRNIDGMTSAADNALQRNEDEVKMISKDTGQEWPYQKDYDKLVAEQKELEEALGLTKDDATAAAMGEGEEIVDDSVAPEPTDGSEDDNEDDDGDVAPAKEPDKPDIVAKDKSPQQEKRHREYLMGNAKNLSEAMRIFNTAPESDKRLLFSTARKKAFDARSNPREWRDPRTRAIALKYFHVKPPGSRNTSGIGVPKPIQ